ncbi:hypothetical protein RYX36_033981, partial [Vicia faba]
MATREVNKPQSLPPYPEMILKALDALNEANGSNKSAIANNIESIYGELPEGHAVLLSYHLNQMKESGDLVFAKNNYSRPDPSAPPKRGRGRPPKAKDPLASPPSAVVSPPATLICFLLLTASLAVQQLPAIAINHHHSMSNFSSPQVSNLTPSPMQRSAVGSHGNVNPVHENGAHLPMRNNSLAVSENRSSSVFWDQAAGHFVPNTSRAQGSSQVPGTELTPALSEQQSNAGTRNNSSVGGVLAGDNTLNFQAFFLTLLQASMATREVNKPQSLPPYPEMILKALDALNEANGSNKSAIANNIESIYGELPEGHAVLLNYHLNQMKESGDLVFAKNNYSRPDPSAPPKRGRGRPPKAKDPLASPPSAVVSPPTTLICFLLLTASLAVQQLPATAINHHHSMSNFSSPQVSNLTPSPMQRSAVGSHGNVNPVHENGAHLPMRNNSLAVSENRSSSVFWDQAAGRFVPNTSRAQGSSQVPGTELTPALSEQQSNAGTRNNSSVGGVLAGDNTLNFQAFFLTLLQASMATREVNKPQSLPPYPEMILKALDALNEANGSNKSAIANNIESIYGELPEGHAVLLNYHLNQMKESGDLVFAKNNYSRPDPSAPPKRGRGRPPKAKDPLASPPSAVVSPPTTLICFLLLTASLAVQQLPATAINHHHSMSNFSSPQVSNLTPSPMQRSAVGSHGNVNPVHENGAHLPMRNNSLAVSENRSSSVFWDQAAGRFVPNTSRAQGSSQVPGTELTPALSEQQSNAGTRNNSSVGGVLAGDNT